VARPTSRSNAELRLRMVSAAFPDPWFFTSGSDLDLQFLDLTYGWSNILITNTVHMPHAGKGHRATASSSPRPGRRPIARQANGTGTDDLKRTRRMKLRMEVHVVLGVGLTGCSDLEFRISFAT
jgi:hypothetical protein